MYRILTENKNPDQIKKILESLCLDYTVYYGDGSWHGQTENSIMIELDNTSGAIAETAARLIKETNFQQSVLLQEIPVTSRLI